VANYDTRGEIKAPLATDSNATPKFDFPPVIETALSLEFKPLKGWSIPHFGLFWQRIRTDFPEVSVQPSLGSEIETFDKPRMVIGPQLALVNSPEVRCWFYDSKGDQLVQVQHDRFVHNWRRAQDQAYPSYDLVKPRFESNWGTFCRFLSDEGLSAPDVVQCELTYVNHFEAGREWQSMGDVAEMLSPWSGEFSGNFLPNPEAVQIGASFLMPDGRGRLRISLQPVMRTADRKEILQFNLVARGAPASSNLASILEWFDLGHEWIVRGFADLTSPKMHSLWQRRR
jgi:uncharacterized protein (TIGR04255 family)